MQSTPLDLDRLLAVSGKGELKVSLYSKNLPSCLTALYEGYVCTALHSANSAAPQESVFVTPFAASSKGCSCRCCGLSFSNVAEQQTHFRDEAHVVALKRSLQKLGTGAPEDAAEEGGAEEGDGDSDSSDEEVLEDSPSPSFNGTAKSFEEGVASKVFGRDGPHYSLEIAGGPVHWELLVPSVLVDSCSADDDDPNPNPFVKVGRCISSIRESSKLWAVFILRSGKFAGAIFDCGATYRSPITGQEAEPLVHKVIKRYTVRACAGGSQSSHDNQGRNAKSAGAMLRRYNEQALKEDVRELLKIWSAHIDSCYRIVMSCSKTMRGVLLDDANGSPLLSKADPRLLHAPFVVRDVTFDQTKAVLSRCVEVTFRARPSLKGAREEAAPAAAPASAPAVAPAAPKAATATSASRRVVTAKDEPDALALFTAVRAGDIDAAESAILPFSAHPLGAAYLLALPEDEELMLTALHIAAEEGRADIVYMLLLRGCSLESVDARGRFPYFLSKDKATRDAFRRYRGVAGEGQHDYERAGVPAAITAEGEEQRAMREREKRAQRARKKKEQKESEKRDKAEAERLLQQQQEQDQLRRERERLSAGNCDVCNASLYGQRLNVFDKFVCSAGCVAALRRRLAADAAEARFKRK